MRPVHRHAGQRVHRARRRGERGEERRGIRRRGNARRLSPRDRPPDEEAIVRAGLALDGPDAELAWEAASEFGEPSCEPIEREVIVSIEEWLDPSLDLLDVDRRIHQTENTPFALRI